MKKLVIFGVGLIGGSVALALKRNDPNLHITGLGRAGDSLQHALDLGVVNAVADDVRVVADADVVMLATPVAQTSAILGAIAPHLAKQTVITDAGSTKSDVLAAAHALLGPHAPRFVPGHPIAGAEKSGVSAASASLFEHKNVVLTPDNSTDPDAISAIAQLWQDAGAKVSMMSAAEHDGIFAAVSHLPHLLAFALVDDLAARDNARQLFAFAASGFRDFTRIAGSSPEMWRDISLANRSALLQEIAAFQLELGQLQALLQDSDGQGLQALFERASHARNAWTRAQLPPQENQSR